MGYTAPTTRATGYYVTAADWNTDLVDNITFLANKPCCRIYKAASQSITNNALTIVTFDTERFDNDNMHESVTAPTRITCRTAGVYALEAGIVWQADTDYTRRLFDILLNGTTILARRSDESPAHAVANDEGWIIATTYKLAVNDYVEVRVFQTNTSAGANNITAALNYSPEFSAVWESIG